MRYGDPISTRHTHPRNCRLRSNLNFQLLRVYLASNRRSSQFSHVFQNYAFYSNRMKVQSFMVVCFPTLLYEAGKQLALFAFAHSKTFLIISICLNSNDFLKLRTDPLINMKLFLPVGLIGVVDSKSKEIRFRTLDDTCSQKDVTAHAYPLKYIVR